MEPATTEPLMLTVKEVGQTTKLSKTEINRLFKAGRLRGKKHGRRTLVSMDSVKEFLHALPDR